MTGTIHKARIGTSKRLQRFLRLLSDGRPHTSWDIIMNARVVAPGTCASELRANGIPVACRNVGDGKFAYQLGDRVDDLKKKGTEAQRDKGTK